MAGELTSDHASYLRGRVGRAPTAGELYAAHFLGPQGAARLIQAMQTSPGASAAALFPEAAGANRSIFYRGGRSLTVAEVYSNLTRTTGGGGAVTPRPAAPDLGFVEYASARRADKTAREQQDALVEFILRGPQGLDTDTGSGSSGSRGLGSSLLTSEMLRVLSEARKDGR
jgi:hypothetical protein